MKESVCETAYEEIRLECHLPTGTRPNMLPSMKEVDAVFQSLKQADGCKRTNDLSLSSFSPQLSLLSWCHLVMVPTYRPVGHTLPTVQVQVELQVLEYWNNVIIIHDSVARNGKSDMYGWMQDVNKYYSSSLLSRASIHGAQLFLIPTFAKTVNHCIDAREQLPLVKSFLLSAV